MEESLWGSGNVSNGKVQIPGGIPTKNPTEWKEYVTPAVGHDLMEIGFKSSENEPVINY